MCEFNYVFVSQVIFKGAVVLGYIIVNAKPA